MSRKRKCSECGAVIIAALSDVGSANDICLECSGATLADFLDDDMTEEDYRDNQVELLRTFHGKD